MSFLLIKKMTVFSYKKFKIEERYMRDFSILDNLTDGVQIINYEMKYIYLNQQLLNDIQMTSQNIIGFRMQDKFPGIENTEIYREIKICMQTKIAKSITNEFQFPNGKKTFHELRISPVDEGVIIFSRDITSSKKGELLLLETNRELERFAFLSAHSLREPLKHLSIFSDLLMTDYKSKMPTEAVKICQNIHDKSVQISKIVSDLRELSDIGDQKLSRIHFSITDVMKSIRENDLTVDADHNFKMFDQHIYVNAYISLVTLLLRTLLKNAYQHGDGHIDFSVDTNQKNPVFCLSNKTNSTSISENIFESKFIQQERLGLGIAICKRIIDRHHGKIWSEINNQIISIYFTLDTDLE